MKVFPEIGWSIWSGGWFSILFLVATIVAMRATRGDARRVTVRPAMIGLVERGAAVLGMVLFQGTIAFSLAVPLRTLGWRFWLGVCLFAAGTFVYAWALIAMVRAETGRPVTDGPYAVTRNPQQIFSVVAWTGAGFAMGTWFFALVGLARLALAVPTFASQERACLKRFGEEYAEYMRRVPRFFWSPFGRMDRATGNGRRARVRPG